MKYIYLFTLLISFSASTNTIIYTSSYIDVINQKVLKNYSITIEENKIVSIDKGFIDINNNDLIDLRGMTVMPGLMDMHVHFGQEYQSKAER
ncbi:MAG: amidohydrolase family protein, partial [Candidatus Neomarinimicrobiota bacterium]